jgi:hypothetical protein
VTSAATVSRRSSARARAGDFFLRRPVGWRLESHARARQPRLRWRRPHRCTAATGPIGISWVASPTRRSMRRHRPSVTQSALDGDAVGPLPSHRAQWFFARAAWTLLGSSCHARPRFGDFARRPHPGAAHPREPQFGSCSSICQLGESLRPRCEPQTGRRRLRRHGHASLASTQPLGSPRRRSVPLRLFEHHEPDRANLGRFDSNATSDVIEWDGDFTTRRAGKTAREMSRQDMVRDD